MSENHGSVTEWITLCQAGDQDAATALWNRYYQDLLTVARYRLRNSKLTASDEEDLAIAVFTSLFSGLASGRIAAIHNRKHLWRILNWATKRRAVDHLRRQQAGKRGGNKANEGHYSELLQDIDDMDAAAKTTNCPEFQTQFNDELEHLLAKLPNEDLRKILRWRLEGFTNLEIKDMLDMSISSIERKIRSIKDLLLLEFSE